VIDDSASPAVLTTATDPPEPAGRAPAYDTHRFWLTFADDWLREVHALRRPGRRDDLTSRLLAGTRPQPETVITVYRDPDDAAVPVMAEWLLNLWWQRWGSPPMLAYGFWWPPPVGYASYGGQLPVRLRQTGRNAQGDPVWDEWRLCRDMALTVLDAHARRESVEPGTDPPAWESRLTLRTAERYPSWPPAGPGPREVLTMWMDDRIKHDGHARTRVLHEDYRAWCEARGHEPADETAFGTMLTGEGYPSYKSGGQMHRRLSLLPA
jgi:hypothetical protein